MKVNKNDGQTRWMHFLIKDDDLLQKNNTILDKVINMKLESDSERIYNKKFLKVLRKVPHLRTVQ